MADPARRGVPGCDERAGRAGYLADWAGGRSGPGSQPDAPAVRRGGAEDVCGDGVGRLLAQHPITAASRRPCGDPAHPTSVSVIAENVIVPRAAANRPASELQPLKPVILAPGPDSR